VRGAALFADISGFTPLTEALVQEHGPRRGAEELSVHLDGIFHVVIEEVHRQGGDVVYFSGDAITCWFDGDDGIRAAACGLAMQDALVAHGPVRTSGGSVIPLAIKVAVAVGSARRFVVGDPEVQLLEVLAGALIDDLAATEHVAEKGDVVLDRSAMASLQGRVTLHAERDDGRGGTAGVLAALVGAPPPAIEPPTTSRLGEDQVRPWLLPTVYERLTAGRGEFVAELRPAHPMFIRFGGFDHDGDPDAPAKLDTFVRAAQEVLTRYGGNLLQLTLGDKGAYLYAVFGSPISHEDDALRAARAAIDLLALDSVGGAVGLQIGIAHGRLRSGTYGHPDRRTFVCLGDAVNLAARLMAGAPAGEVHTSEAVRRAAGDDVRWTDLGTRTVKGKAEEIQVFRLDGTLAQRARAKRYRLALVGREPELDTIKRVADEAAAAGRLLVIEGEAGRGKSRLVAEAVRRMRRSGTTVCFGVAERLSSASYGVWEGVLRSILGVADTEPAQLAARASARLAVLDPGLLPRLPLLSAVLGSPIPDNDLTVGFDAKLRKTSLESLVLDVVRATARRTALTLVLEDWHLADALSRDLLEAVAQGVADSPVLVLTTQRPGGSAPQQRALPTTRMVLDDLSPGDTDELTDMVCRHLFQQSPGPALQELVRERCEGNPYHVEELLQYLHQLGLDPQATSYAEVDLPGSLEAVVLSRIDRSPEGPRRTAKVASVVGLRFTVPVVRGAYPELGAAPVVAGHLEDLRALDLVAPEHLEDQSWLYHHRTVRDVAYESLPYRLREELHERVADHLERTDPDIDELALHYDRSRNVDKKRHYLRLAAEAAAARYANDDAISYFERLLTVAEPSERPGVLLHLAQVLELTGAWERAEEAASQARAEADQRGELIVVARADVALAEVARKQGRFADAASLLEQARATFLAGGDRAGEARTLHVAGTLAAQEGRYDDAEARYLAARAIRSATGDRAGTAALDSNLGVVAEYRGDLAASRAHHEQALTERRELGDRWAIAVSLTNLGMIAVLERRHGDARLLFDEALRLNLEVGDPWMVATSHHNLGNALRGIGDHHAAGEAYARALRAFDERRDLWALAFLFEDVAVLAAATARAPLAWELMGGADAAREELGAPRAPALEADLDDLLAPALAALGSEAATQARARGREAGLSAATASAALVCHVPRGE
jgi:adenylate cyclase